jgi:hypothetical protein
LHGGYLLDDCLAQKFRRFNFHFGSVFEYIHDQFAAVVKEDAKLVVAIGLLVGMPAFVGNPFGSKF